MSNRAEVKKSVLEKVALLDGWLKKMDFKYYTLNDTPISNFINKLSSKMKLVGITWRQLFRLFPVDFRKAFFLSSGIINPQATIILAESYLELLQYDSVKYQFKKSFDLLIERIISLCSNKTKFFAIKQGKHLHLAYYSALDEDVAPLLTAWAGNLFIKAFKRLGESIYLKVAKQIRNYFIYEHPRELINNNVYFYYTPTNNLKVWNASAEISAFLIKFGALYNDVEAYELGRKGIQMLIDLQNPDGSWFYGDGRMTKYIDNFHTAFILRSFINSYKYWRDQQLYYSFKKGIEFYRSSFFVNQYGNKYIYPKHWIKKFPPLNSSVFQKIDIRDCALSIIVFCETEDIKYIEIATKIMDWTNKKMFRADTYYAERTWFWINKIPYLDFQAWMLLANAKLLSVLKNR